MALFKMTVCNQCLNVQFTQISTNSIDKQVNLRLDLIKH